MNVLITGGNGFIGTAITEHLNGQGITTLDFSLPEQNILDKDVLEKFVEKADHVIHLAGLLGTHELTENPGPAVDTNIRGTVNLLEAMRNVGGHQRLLFISKPNVWLNTYSITKKAAEEFCEMFGREFGTKYVIMKVFNAYGPGQRLDIYKKAIPHFIVNSLLGKDLEIYGDGLQTVDLVHTSDVAKAFHLALTAENVEGETIEVGSGAEMTVNELAQMIIRLCKSKSKIVHLPMRRGEKEKTRLCAETTKLNKLLGTLPARDHEEKMSETIVSYAKMLKAKLAETGLK